jgi:hypothetical protein
MSGTAVPDWWQRGVAAGVWLVHRRGGQSMRIIDAEAQVITDLKDEGRIVSEKQYPSFKITAVRHPTLGKLVLIEDGAGNGAMVEAEE